MGLDSPALDPFSRVELLSIKEVTFFYLNTFFFKIRVGPRKMKLSSEKSNFCIAFKTLTQGNLQAKLLIFFSKILMLHRTGTSLEKFHIKLRVDFYHLSQKIFKTIAR
jgi:hypothetical protein